MDAVQRIRLCHVAGHVPGGVESPFAFRSICPVNGVRFPRDSQDQHPGSRRARLRSSQCSSIGTHFHCRHIERASRIVQEILSCVI